MFKEIFSNIIIMDIQISNVDIKPVLKNGKLWTPPAKSKRIDPITGIYNNRPTDPEYYANYYHLKKDIKVECPCCGFLTPKLALSKHMKSKTCKRIGEIMQKCKPIILETLEI
jgi:hypothetical protein